jgi:hypothetical protein
MLVVVAGREEERTEIMMVLWTGTRVEENQDKMVVVVVPWMGQCVKKGER